MIGIVLTQAERLSARVGGDQIYSRAQDRASRVFEVRTWKVAEAFAEMANEGRAASAGDRHLPTRTMQQTEMTDEEVRQQVDRADRFHRRFRELITSIALDPDPLVTPPVVHGLRRIAATVDAVDYVVFCNLANVNEAMRGTLLSVLEVKLMCVGPGPALDYADAAAFLAELHEPIYIVWKRHLHYRRRSYATGRKPSL